jgi:hypothetical protein
VAAAATRWTGRYFFSTAAGERERASAAVVRRRTGTRARVCKPFDEHPLASRPMGRFDRGVEGDREDMTTH